VSATYVVMPQLGVNDDTALVVQWLVGRGDEIQPGIEIAVIETSKASVGLEAEGTGFLYPVVEAGTEVAVQHPIALLLDRPDEAEANRLAAELREQPGPAGYGSGRAEPQLTKKARALVEQLGVDPSRLPTDRVVRESDVRALVPEPDEPPAEGALERRVAVYGASQGGASLAETIATMGGYEVVAFIDDTEALAGTEFLGVPVWAGAGLERIRARNVGAVATHIAIRPFRLALRGRAAASGLHMPNVVHSDAWVAPSVRLGRGNVIKAGAVVDTSARLGDCCIVDNGAIIAHHNEIGDGAHLAPGVAMGGDCRVGAETLVGVGAVIGPRVVIGRNVIVGPGAVVSRDVPDDAVVEGRPAKIVGSRKAG